METTVLLQSNSLPANLTLTDIRRQTDQGTLISSGTEPPVLQRQVTSKVAAELTRQDRVSSVNSDSESDISDRPPENIFVEEGELSDNQGVTLNYLDQSLSEEQTYRETMRGIRSYMGWTHIP